MTPPLPSLKTWISLKRRNLYKGCGSHHNYHGHECKSTFINTFGKKVTVYCDECEGKLNMLKEFSKAVKRFS